MMRWSISIAVAAILLQACGTPTAPQGTASIRLVQAGSADTIRFEVPVVARSCAVGGGILMSGARRGQGVLLWLRADRAVSDTGAYPLLVRGDSGSARGAIAAVRFVVGPVSHGFTVDDGLALVTSAAPSFAVHVQGRGVEPGLGGQRSAELALAGVPLAPDTVSCQAQP
jgi:hypothetical protein